MAPTDRKYVPRVEPFYAWLYEGQPKDEWPEWLAKHYSGSFHSGTLDKHIGRYATATMHNELKEFWRWFDAYEFEHEYVAADSETELHGGQRER
jgi:hypothetical protein